MPIHDTHGEMMHLLKQMENPFLHHIDLQLNRMQMLMEALGRPDEELPPIIHVAGTNGKGSLIAYIRAIYEQSGKKPHVYTSPHLVRFNERIILAGEEVGDADFLAVLQKVHRLREQFPATLFEGVTAAAFLLFAKIPADVLMLEVGLGGRLDATNVVVKPAVSVITPISLDHMEFLGDTVTLIAREKAGIIKKDAPCVVGPQIPEVMTEITLYAEKLSARLHRYGIEWELRQEADGRYFYQSDTLAMEIPRPVLHGAHQWQNAATAIAVMDVLMQQGKASFSEAVIAKGLTQAVWPGRLQRLHSDRRLSLLPEGSELWLDGGHNPAAGIVLSNWMKEHWGADAKAQIICGMVKSKDVRGFLQHLLPRAEKLWAVPIHDEPRAMTPGEIEEIGRSQGCAHITTAHNVAEALTRIGEESREPQKVLIAGSLYLAGTVLAEGL